MNQSINTDCQILVFKTNIRTKKQVKNLRLVLDSLLFVNDWSVDLDDIDNVLRVVTSGNLNETDIIGLVEVSGFECEILL